MGLEVLFWIVLLTYVTKRSAEDVLHAVKGTPNPRHQARMERIKRGESQARYGVRGWLDDATEDFLRANTQWRRTRAAQRAAKRLDVPLDDLAEAVREDRPAPRQQERNVDREEAQRITAEWEAEQRREAEWRRDMKPIGDDPKPTCMGCLKVPAQTGSVYCLPCDVARGYYSDGEATQPTTPEPDNRPTARIYPFPIRNIEKEITMANSEVTGLSTAIAYARDVAKAHESFSTSGAEGYVGALEQGGNGAEVIGSAREAMEASAIAAQRWAAHREVLERQMTVKEAYQSQPDAGDKQFVVNE